MMVKRAVQNHHISYEPEVIVKIYKGEHGVLTRLQWWCSKGCSKGFIKALKQYIAENEDKAEDLDGQKE